MPSKSKSRRDVVRTFRLKPLAWLAACALGPGLTAQAQEVAQLQAIVVSGSRVEQSADDLPMSIDVIGTETMEEKQVRDIRDLARELPNVSVQRSPARFGMASGSTGRDQNAGFNIRGLDGNRVLVLVDGIRQPRSYAFGATSFGRDYLDVGLIQRVEVVRGATSALYGSDGMGGLVHFITADPDNLLDQNDDFAGRISLGYDSANQSKRLGTTLAGRINDELQWLLGASVSRAQELDNQGDNDSKNATRTTPNPQEDENYSLLGKLVWTPGAGQRHALTLEHVDKSSDYELLTARTATVLRSDASTDMERSRATWDSRWQTQSALADEVRAVLSYQDAHSREWADEDRTTTDRVRDTTYDETTWQSNLQGNKLLRMGGGSAQKITYGVDYVVTDVVNEQDGVTPPAGETFPLKRFPDTRETSTALYVQDEFIIGDFSVTPGVRFDHYSIDASQKNFNADAKSISGDATSPKLGVLWRATDQWSLFGNYAAGFRAPNAGQINAFFENAAAGYKTIPNPDLKPETSQNFELGLRGRLDGVSFDFAAFTGRYKDFIEDTYKVGGAGTQANPTVYQSVNIGRVEISGFEAKADIRWGAPGQFAGGTLSSPLSYSQARGRDTAQDVPLDSINPARMTAGVRYDTPVWMVRLDATHSAAKDKSDVDSSTQFLPDAYTVYDLSGQWRIRKDLRLTAGVYNLTDEKYWNWSDVQGLAASSAVLDAYTQPGRSVRVSMSADF
ncbi:TonB-dependent hemoglobin/transferrin/lactoferrin family receptor [Hylemonella sp. W303a]|uniref:TonB-dependent hemoglobin/transferrin/lactoferrin family receptor n=1 Tax=Hylemonella sp. W303a TaxID=3389873 RepID=UPI00396B2F5B